MHRNINKIFTSKRSHFFQILFVHRAKLKAGSRQVKLLKTWSLRSIRHIGHSLTHTLRVSPLNMHERHCSLARLLLCFLVSCLFVSFFFLSIISNPWDRFFLSQFFLTASPACLHVTEQSLFSIKTCWASYTARGRCKRYYQGGCRAIICPLPLTLVLASHLRGGEAHTDTASFPPIFLRQVCLKEQS